MIIIYSSIHDHRKGTLYTNLGLTFPVERSYQHSITCFRIKLSSRVSWSKTFEKLLVFREAHSLKNAMR